MFGWKQNIRHTYSLKMIPEIIRQTYSTTMNAKEIPQKRANTSPFRRFPTIYLPLALQVLAGSGLFFPRFGCLIAEKINPRPGFSWVWVGLFKFGCPITLEKRKNTNPDPVWVDFPTFGCPMMPKVDSKTNPDPGLGWAWVDFPKVWQQKGKANPSAFTKLIWLDKQQFSHGCHLKISSTE